MTYKIRKTFSCAHFYRQAQWSVEKNQAEFGKCFTEYGHGHDYILILKFQTENLSEATGAIEEIVEKLDHQHLNLSIPEFQLQIPTTENLALFIQNQISQKWMIKNIKAQVLSLRLQENPEIWVEISALKGI